MNMMMMMNNNKYFIIEVQDMWNVKAKVIPVIIRANRSISK